MKIQCKCQYCDKECKYKRSLSTHQKYCLNNPNRIENLNNLNKKPYKKNNNIYKKQHFKCEFCGINLYTMKFAYTRHILHCKQNPNYTEDASARKGTHISEKTRKKLQLNAGGLRHGAGRGKKGRYKGIWCDSSWELAFVIYNLEHNITIERNKDYFEYTYNNEIHKYFPDFIINDEYIEIKGFDTDKVNAKIEQFPKDKILKVYHKEDLNEVFDYVINKYGDDFIKLYE